jgi:putative transposase
MKQRKQLRLKEYDYANDNAYFVTVCSKNRKNIFGKIEFVGEGLAPSRYKIELNDLGEIILQEWNDIPNRYTNGELDEYVIMPNHIHGILIINSQDMYRANAI